MTLKSGVRWTAHPRSSAAELKTPGQGGGSTPGPARPQSILNTQGASDGNNSVAAPPQNLQWFPTVRAAPHPVALSSATSTLQLKRSFPPHGLCICCSNFLKHHSQCGGAAQGGGYSGLRCGVQPCDQGESSPLSKAPTTPSSARWNPLALPATKTMVTPGMFCQ